MESDASKEFIRLLLRLAFFNLITSAVKFARRKAKNFKAENPASNPH